MAPLSKKQKDQNSELYESVVAANNVYAQTYVAQPDPFSHKNAVLLTCMDARILTHNIMGFYAGDMYVIRNAGGRASDDAIRSLVIALTLLKANQFFVVHHTECGMQRFTDKSMTELVNSSMRRSANIGYCNVTLKTIKNNKNYLCSKESNCCKDKAC